MVSVSYERDAALDVLLPRSCVKRYRQVTRQWLERKEVKEEDEDAIDSEDVPERTGIGLTKFYGGKCLPALHPSSSISLMVYFHQM